MALKNLYLRLRPPLWARWTLALLAGAAAVVALVAFVSHNNNDDLAHQSPKAEARANHEGAVLVEQDQAPHTVHVAAGHSARAALVAAVRARIRQEVTTGEIDGPLQSVSCRASGRRGTRVGYACNARAADLRYPFVAVATLAAHEIVFCKRDPPPAPSVNVPVSPRCQLNAS